MEKELTSGELLNAIETIVQRNITNIVPGIVTNIVKAEIQESQTEILETIHEFATHVDQRFDQVDKRFDQIDRRFDGLDRLLLGDGFPIVRSVTPLPRRRRR